MVNFMFTAATGMALLGIACRADAWGGKKDEEEPQMPGGKEAVDLARAGFRQVSGDIGLLNDLLKDLQDRETLSEVEKLMQDNKFQKEVDKLMESAEWKTGAENVMEFLKDPEAMELVKEKTKEYQEFFAAGPGKDGKKDAALGLNTAAQGMMDPNFMKDAMEMMKDPEVMQQVQETMKNPDFQEEMKKLMENPAMKERMAQAGANIEEIMKNPELMAEAQRQVAGMMGSAGEL